MLRLLIILAVGSFAVAEVTKRSIEKRAVDYEYVSGFVSYSGAVTACENIGKVIVQLCSEAEQNDLEAYLASQFPPPAVIPKAWIGVRYSSGKWRCGTGAALSYQNWVYPPGSNTGCAFLHRARARASARARRIR
ncbi:uncharacterized protein LOC102802914 [Saccoglossus kowalevskii]|uniref:Uncharacterized protein LOC102802914 n=1 Tax=Saccoglossus kowalevskii TaxID=10224 RepID=A0ABM0LWN5_SACKO|nr:PREDICTED: uncharacterized protein LOC102802914 [Saccoglossus kowalevskii]